MAHLAPFATRGDSMLVANQLTLKMSIGTLILPCGRLPLRARVLRGMCTVLLDWLLLLLLLLL